MPQIKKLNIDYNGNTVTTNAERNSNMLNVFSFCLFFLSGIFRLLFSTEFSQISQMTIKNDIILTGKNIFSVQIPYLHSLSMRLHCDVIIFTNGQKDHNDKKLVSLFWHIISHRWPTAPDFTAKSALQIFESFSFCKRMGHIDFTMTSHNSFSM